MFCINCGCEIQKEWKYCQKCGNKIVNVNEDDIFDSFYREIKTENFYSTKKKSESTLDTQEFEVFSNTMLTIKKASSDLFVYDNAGKCIYVIGMEFGGKVYRLRNSQKNIVAVIEAKSSTEALIRKEKNRLWVDTGISLKGAYYRISGKEWKVHPKLGGAKYSITEKKVEIGEIRKNMWGSEYITINCIRGIDTDYLIILVLAIEAIGQYNIEHPQSSSSNNYHSNRKDRKEAEKRYNDAVKKNKNWKDWLKNDKYYPDWNWDNDSDDND